jgi:hypothetical protein
LYAVFRSGILIKDETFAMRMLIPLSIAAFIPVIHIELLHRGIYPVGFVMRRVFKKRGSPKWVLLMLTSLQIHLTAWQALTALTISWLAFLVPVPAGLGALEAGQIFALGGMGYSPATALSLTLLMRARDILNGGLGLLISGRGLKIKAGQGGCSG